jgi:anti-sigma regulatory factor (Ser/Thr protein kinase)
MILEAVERTLDGGALRGASSVSAWIGVLDPLDLQLHYASAGHPAPLLRGADRVVRSLSSGDAPLGIGSRSARSSYAVALAPGSALLLTTDGLIEADRDVIRPATPVKDAFALLDGAAGPETLREMARGGRAQHDDVALLYIGIDRAGGAADGVLTWTFDAGDALEGRRVRHAVAGALLALGYPDDAVFNAELVFGELLGNVVRHAGGRVEIRLDGSMPDAVLHVLDEGRGFARNPKLSDAWAEGGRGLALIEFLVDDFSVSHRAGRGAHARAVLRRYNEPLVDGIATPSTTLAALNARANPLNAASHK